jgi:phage I-like protein
MNLILNRDFKMPDDGWYQLAPLGEFPHAMAGVVQVVDAESCTAMVARFKADAAVPNFAGLLVDFDHFSLDERARSEAAGWIVDLEARGKKSDGAVVSDGSDDEGWGLWGKIRWSDLGEAAVKGGRYRFLSPVWARPDCVDLGPDPLNGRDRVRPVRLLNAAVTNDPNLKGLRPLSNASTGTSSGSPVDSCASIGRSNENGKAPSDAKAMEGREGKSMKAVIEKLVNHLGLAADATEAVILEKLAGLPALTVVTELQNSLSAARTELDALKGTLKGVEGELVNRHLEEFAGVVTEKTKPFWMEQLMANRAGAIAALEDLAAGRETGREEPTPALSKEGNQSRKPLHNRATARPVIPGQGAGGAEGDSKAVKIRNRAHELVAAEKIPFGVAFRRAEKEVVGQ